MREGYSLNLFHIIQLCESIVWIATKIRSLHKEELWKLSCICHTAAIVWAPIWLQSFIKAQGVLIPLLQQERLASYSFAFYISCLKVHTGSILNCGQHSWATYHFSQHGNCLACGGQSHPTGQCSNCMFCFHLGSAPVPCSGSLHTFAKHFLVLLTFGINFAK